MRHLFFGIFIVCLTLAASVVSAQRVVVREAIDEEMFQNVITEEYEGVMSTVDIGISEEEMLRMMERQRQRDEMFLQVFAEIGITEEEWKQFEETVNRLNEKYEETGEQLSDSFDLNADELTRNDVADICKTYADFYVDKLIHPMMSDVLTEAARFFGEEKYTQLAIRSYQVLEMFPEEAGCEDEVFKLTMLPDIIDLTEEQLNDLVQMQKELFTELFEFHYALDTELESLMRKFSEVESEEEQAAISERMEKVSESLGQSAVNITRPIRTNMRTKLDTLLTAEQKVKLSKIKADIPDYMRSALADMKTGGINDNAEEASGPWRPGANSWVPGMGAPTNLKNDNREAPRIREPRGERQFPTE